MKDTVKAGAAIVLCLAVLGVAVVILGGYRFWEELDYYHIRFRSVKDLSPGRPVKYGGLDVGRILSIGVDPEDPRLIRVEIGLTERMTLRQGVVARIAQKGLVGDYYVFLDPQGEPGEVIKPGTFIESMETVDMSQLAGLMGDILNSLRPRLETIAKSLEEILAADNASKIRELFANAPVMVEELRRAAESIKKDFNAFAGEGRKTAEYASKTLKTLEHSVEVLRGELERTLAGVRVEVKQMGDLAGTVRKAVKHDQEQLEDILANVERVSSDLKHLSAKLRERPWEILNQPKERKP
jgi:phospholipid/cholesterol/gamma-HCH transport system substrate-binding protein